MNCGILGSLNFEDKSEPITSKIYDASLGPFSVSNASVKILKLYLILSYKNMFYNVLNAIN